MLQFHLVLKYQQSVRRRSNFTRWYEAWPQGDHSTQRPGAAVSTVLGELEVWRRLVSESSGKRTRLACWRWRPRHRGLFRMGKPAPFNVKGISARAPKCAREGACAPQKPATALAYALFRCESWIAMVMITDLLARKYRFNVPGTKANLNWTRRMQRSIAQLRSSRRDQTRMQLINELLIKTGRV